MPVLLGIDLNPAYIDSGTGSMIFQAIAAGLFASLFALKGAWARVKMALSVRRASEQPKTLP